MRIQSLSEKQSVALAWVRDGKVISLRASGAYWRGTRGETLPRGMGLTLTTLRRKGLVEIVGEPDKLRRRRVRLTAAGRAALRAGQYIESKG